MDVKTVERGWLDPLNLRRLVACRQLSPDLPREKGAVRTVLAMLGRDRFATAAVVFLLVMALCAIFGPALLGEAATKQNLRGRNLPPFSLEHGWLMILGADALGPRRPVLVPNERGLDRALELGLSSVAIFGSATQTFARKNLNRTVEESLDMFAPVVERARRLLARAR